MRRRSLVRWSFQTAGILFLIGGAAPEAGSTVVRVPQDYVTIQNAIDAATNGDTVLVSPGAYAGGLVISGKIITLGSRYVLSRNPNDITQTTIDGGSPILEIQASAGPGTTVRGLTFINGTYQIVNHARGVNLVNDHFISGSGDQVSFEGAGGWVWNCTFDHAGDDGIDADGASNPTIEDNTITNAANDGIEIRLHSYTGPTLQYVIRDNVISGSVEDGIQLIDYPGVSSRTFRIERNILAGNGKAGLGCMANGASTENFAGAPLGEEVQVIGNTFSGNPYGMTGGDSMLVVNNIFVGATGVGVHRVSGSSQVSYNDFWNNATAYDTSNVVLGTTLQQDPLLDAKYYLKVGSPCIDAGAASFVWNGNPVFAPPYSGSAPDLGAREFINAAVSTGPPPRSNELVLAGVRPNPSRTGFAVALALPDASPARIEVFDVAGRRILSRDLKGLGPGSHLVSLPETRALPVGAYLVRLSQGHRLRTSVGVVIR